MTKNEKIWLSTLLGNAEFKSSQERKRVIFSAGARLFPKYSETREFIKWTGQTLAIRSSSKKFMP